MGGVGSNCW